MNLGGSFHYYRRKMETRLLGGYTDEHVPGEVVEDVDRDGECTLELGSRDRVSFEFDVSSRDMRVK